MRNTKEKTLTIKPRVVALLTAVLVFSLASSAFADEVVTGEVAVEKKATPDKDKSKYKAPYRGTSISYRNEISAVSLDREHDLTHNPYYAMSWMFHPMWWVGDVFNMALTVPISRELTESDWTTNSGETVLGDVSVGFGLTNFYTIPVLDLGFSARLGFKAPTSKMSRARSLILGISPGLSVSRNFDVLEGINLSYSLGFTKNFHEFSTAGSNDSKIDGGCAGQGASCAFMNSGVRNTSWALSNTFALDISFLEWLSVGANVGVLQAYLYDQGDNADMTSVNNSFGDDSIDKRYLMIYGLEIATAPVPALSIAIGAETSNTQIGPDGTYNKPFFNRYTAIYLDLRLSFAGLVSQVTSSEE